MIPQRFAWGMKNDTPEICLGYGSSKMGGGGGAGRIPLPFLAGIVAKPLPFLAGIGSSKIGGGGGAGRLTGSLGRV